MVSRIVHLYFKATNRLLTDGPLCLPVKDVHVVHVHHHVQIRACVRGSTRAMKVFGPINR
jgi:hypothetical protein